MNPLLTVEERGDDYESIDWDSYNRFMADFRCRQFERDIALIERFCPEKGHLLDIGTGTGEFLDVATRHGFIAHGIEPSGRAIEKALKKGHVIKGRFEDLTLQENFFNVVTMWSVLEHVPQPVNFLQKAHNLLKENGLLALRVPLSSSLINILCILTYKISGHLISKPLIQFYQLDWQSQHFFLFTEFSLFLLLKKTGFQPVWRRRENGFDVATLRYRLNFRLKNWLYEKILSLTAGIILTSAKLLRKEDEIVLLARKV
jgi:ubiquinone/menaquinone biosynthesis C-methylase UbiE